MQVNSKLDLGAKVFEANGLKVSKTKTIWRDSLLDGRLAKML